MGGDAGSSEEVSTGVAEGLEEVMGGVAGSIEEVSPGVAEGLEEVVGGVSGSSEEVSLGALKEWRKWWVEFQEVQRKCHQESLNDRRKCGWRCRKFRGSVT